jgi:hypothetical protein
MSSQEFRDFKDKEMKRDDHDFRVDGDGVIYFRDRLCVLDFENEWIESLLYAWPIITVISCRLE